MDSLDERTLRKSERRFFIGSTIVMVVIAILMLIPFVLVVSISMTENQAILQNGYTLFPTKFSFDAYKYIWAKANQIFSSIGISVLVTVVGTTVGVILTITFAYPLARTDYPLHRFMTVFALIPMLFHGGIVPTYIVYTQVFHIKNTIFGLLVPNLLMNVFNVILVRTYYATSVPKDLIEAAHIDGATELRTYLKIVLPLSKPIIGTVALMMGMAYWNDWQNGLYYVTQARLFSLQNLLNRMMSDIQFLQSGQNSLLQGMEAEIARMPQASVRMAIACVGILPVLVIFPFVNRFYAKGITMGAVKG